MKNANTNAHRLWSIFWTFLRIAPVTFGGGYAMIPMLEEEMVQRRKWVKQEEIADVLAISQTIPGAIALNAASFIGYRIAGVGGAVAALFGMLLPTFLIVVGLASVLGSFQQHAKVAAALDGMKPAVIAMVAYAGIRMARTAMQTKWAIGIGLAAAIVLVMQWLSPLLLLVIGAVGGVAYGIWGPRQALIAQKREPVRDPDYFFGEGI